MKKIYIISVISIVFIFVYIISCPIPPIVGESTGDIINSVLGFLYIGNLDASDEITHKFDVTSDFNPHHVYWYEIENITKLKETSLADPTNIEVTAEGYEGSSLTYTAFPWQNTSPSGKLTIPGGVDKLHVIVHGEPTTDTGQYAIRVEPSRILFLNKQACGSIANVGEERWYYFNAIAGQGYEVTWYENSSTYTADIIVSAYQSDFAAPYAELQNDDYSPDWINAAVGNERIYLRVVGNGGSYGTFAIKVVLD